MLTVLLMHLKRLLYWEGASWRLLLTLFFIVIRLPPPLPCRYLTCCPDKHTIISNLSLVFNRTSQTHISRYGCQCISEMHVQSMTKYHGSRPSRSVPPAPGPSPRCDLKMLKEWRPLYFNPPLLPTHLHSLPSTHTWILCGRRAAFWARHTPNFYRCKTMDNLVLRIMSR